MQPSNSFSRQQAKILALLTAAKGGWVPLPQTQACAAQYAARICELRRAGVPIPAPRMKTVNGQRHTWYRLESTPAPMHISQQEPLRTAGESLFPDAPERQHRDDG